MEKFLIEGGIPLKGEVTPAGNKNAALPMLAATLLSEEPIILHNLPEIRDVRDMRKLLESMGAGVENLGGDSWKITAKNLTPLSLDLELSRRIRASILLAGPVQLGVVNFVCHSPVET